MRKPTEDRVVGVESDLALRRIADQAFGVRKRDVGRRRSISLIVRDDFVSAMH